MEQFPEQSTDLCTIFFIIDSDAPIDFPTECLQNYLDDLAQTLLQSENPDVAYNMALIAGGRVLTPIQSIATYWTPPIPEGESVPFAESMALARQLWEEFRDTPTSENIRHLPPWVVAINHSGTPDPYCKEFDSLRLDFQRDIREMRITFLPLAFSEAASKYLQTWNNGYTVAALTADALPLALEELAQGVQEIAMVQRMSFPQEEAPQTETVETAELPEEPEEEPDGEDEPSPPEEEPDIPETPELPDWLFSAYDGEGQPLPPEEAGDMDNFAHLMQELAAFLEKQEKAQKEDTPPAGKTFSQEETGEEIGWDSLPEAEEVPTEEEIPTGEEIPVVEEAPTGERPVVDEFPPYIRPLLHITTTAEASRPRPRRKGTLRRRVKLICRLEETNNQY